MYSFLQEVHDPTRSKRVCKFLPATDSHLNQWIKRKMCAKDFAVVTHLEKEKGVIMYLMEAKLSVTCAEVKCFDFAE